MLRDADPSCFNGIYIVCGYTDLRYGIDSLSAIIKQRYKMSLFVPNTLFLFCDHSSSKIKGLLWEGDGFLLLYKRVEEGRFTWPRSSKELRQMSPDQFRYLMMGFSIDPLIRDITPKYPLSSFCFVQKRDFFQPFSDCIPSAMHSFRKLSYASMNAPKALYGTFLFYISILCPILLRPPYDVTPLYILTVAFLLLIKEFPLFCAIPAIMYISI